MTDHSEERLDSGIDAELAGGAKPHKRRPLRSLPFNKMIPNILTLLALCAGLTGMRFALSGEWEQAALAIAVAAILDALDGRVARLLKGASKFGAELDSLSDFVCFGVAPAMMLYLWALEDVGRIGWGVAMLFTICCGLRLARFNVAHESPDTPAWKARFFTGVPAPAGAGLVLLPLILSFLIGDEIVRHPITVGLFLISVGGLMVSTLPTFSFKKVHVPGGWILPTMLIAGGIAALGVSEPWMLLSIILLSYLATFPVSYLRHRELEKLDRDKAPASSP